MNFVSTSPFLQSVAASLVLAPQRRQAFSRPNQAVFSQQQPIKTNRAVKTNKMTEDRRHIPVLRTEALGVLNVHSGGLYLDATFGAGGYSREILKTDNSRVIGFDRDPNAIRDAQAMVRDFAPRLTLVQSPFSAFESYLDEKLDGIVMDIGVSSMQIDESERGFSFRFDGPLDMRMSQSGPTAADIVNSADEERLANILFYYGDERASRRIAKAIVMDRAKTPFTSTLQLASLLGRLLPSKPTEINPATRTFQALRIAVNDELGELYRALEAAERALKEGGVLSVVTFHSLEDRIVKQFFASRTGKGQAISRYLPHEIAPPVATFKFEAKQPVLPSAQETSDNPRARSAKLRFATRLAAPARPADPNLAKLAGLPEPVRRR